MRPWMSHMLNATVPRHPGHLYSVLSQNWSPLSELSTPGARYSRPTKSYTFTYFPGEFRYYASGTLVTHSLYLSSDTLLYEFLTREQGLSRSIVNPWNWGSSSWRSYIYPLMFYRLISEIYTLVDRLRSVCSDYNSRNHNLTRPVCLEWRTKFKYLFSKAPKLPPKT